MQKFDNKRPSSSSSPKGGNFSQWRKCPGCNLNSDSNYHHVCWLSNASCKRWISSGEGPPDMIADHGAVLEA